MTSPNPSHSTFTKKDNILSNFPPSDGLLVLGRTGLGATLFFSLPILILPMREVCDSDLLDGRMGVCMMVWK